MNLSMDAEGEHLAINIKGKHLVHVAHPSSLEPRGTTQSSSTSFTHVMSS